MNMKKILLPLLFLAPVLLSAQGMWLPMLLEKQNEKDMKAQGLKLSADDIYNSIQPSIKDAICLFDGGCTGGNHLPRGLAAHQLPLRIFCHSTIEQPPGQLRGNRVLGQRPRHRKAGAGRYGDVRQPHGGRFSTRPAKRVGRYGRARPPGTDRQESGPNPRQHQKEKWEEIMILPFYNGNQYFLFVTQTFKDLRFVGAPPSSIGQFGQDTDNWVWPRHTGDFSMFRIYADKDGHPAEYSASNVPYHPRHFLPISLDGVQPGDFTMVYGFPGRTDEYLTGAAVQQIGEVLDPAKVDIRDRALKTMNGFMRKDRGIKIAYVAKYASIANAWKKWLGEMQGLKTYKALEKKTAYETEFTKRVEQSADFKYRYGNLLPRLRQLYKDIEPYALARDYYFETCIRNNEILGQAANLNGLVEAFDKSGETVFTNKQKEFTPALDEFYKDYRPQVDEAVFAGMVEMFAETPNWNGAPIM